MTSRDPDVVSVTESDIPADSQKITPKESRLIPESVTVHSQDVGVIDTAVDEFTLEGDAEFEKSSQSLVTEKGEILISIERRQVLADDTQQTKDSEVVVEDLKLRKSDSETSEDWEMVDGDIDVPEDATDIGPSPDKISEDDETKESSRRKESVEEDKGTVIAETLKDTEDLKTKALSASEEELAKDTVVVELHKNITQPETKSTDDIILKSRSDLDRVITIDQPSAEQLSSPSERSKTEIQEVIRPVDGKADEPDMAENYFTEDWIPNVINMGTTDKQTDKEMAQIADEEQLKDDAGKTEEKEIGEITEEKEPIETKMGEQSPFTREVAVEPGDDEITIQEDELDKIKVKQEQGKLRDEKRESPAETQGLKKEPETVDGKNIKETEKNVHPTKDEWSPDPINVDVKERSIARDERLDDLDDEFKDKDYFREEWSPDAIKTRVDQDDVDKVLVSGSEEEDQFENVEPVSQKEDIKPTDKTKQAMTKDISMSEETERGEEFLYIERHAQISRVFPSAKSSLIEVADQALVETDHTIEPESPDDKDDGSFREDWSPAVIDITTEGTDESKERETPSDSDADLFEGNAPGKKDISAPGLETPEVREAERREKQDEVKQQAAEEHVREDGIYEEYIHEDWTPDVIPQKTDEEEVKKPSPDKEPNNTQAKEYKKPEKLPSESEYTTKGDIYEEYMDEDWTPDVIPQKPGKEELTKPSPEKESTEQDKEPFKTLPSGTETAEEGKEKLLTEKEVTEQAKECKEPKKLPSDMEPDEQYISEGRKVFKEVVCEYTTEGEIYEEYIDEDWTPDVIPHGAGEYERASSGEVAEKEELDVDASKRQFREQIAGNYATEEGIYEETLDDQWMSDVISKKHDVMDKDKPTSEEELEKQIAKVAETEKDEQEPEKPIDEAYKPGAESVLQELDTDEEKGKENVVEDVGKSEEVVEPEPGKLDTVLEKAAGEQVVGEYIAKDVIYEESMAEDWSPDVIPDKLAKGDLERQPAEEAASESSVEVPSVTTAETDIAKYEKTDTFAQDIKYLPDGTTVILQETHEDISKVILDERGTVTSVSEESKVTEGAEVIEEEQEQKKGKRKRKRRRKKNKEPIELLSEGARETKEEKQKLGEHIAGEYIAEGALEDYEHEDWKPDVIPQRPTDEDKEKLLPEAPKEVETPKPKTEEIPKPVIPPEPKGPTLVVSEQPETPLSETSKEPETPKPDGDEPVTGSEDRVTEVVQPTEFDKSETHEGLFPRRVV